EKLQAEMTKQSEEVSIKEELERVKEAVVRQAGEELRLSIADISDEILAVMPYQDVRAKIGQAAAGEWGTRWSEAVEADSQSIAQKKVVERTEGANTRFVVAFYGFLESIHRSHKEIAEAFGDFFGFIEQSFGNMVESISKRVLEEQQKTSSSLEKGVWDNLQRRVDKSAALVDAALKEVRGQIDQALNNANQEAQNVRDSGATQDIFEIIATFQKSVTSAVAEALKTVETQVRRIEQEVIEQEEAGWQPVQFRRLRFYVRYQREICLALKEVLETTREMVSKNDKFNSEISAKYGVMKGKQSASKEQGAEKQARDVEPKTANRAVQNVQNSSATQDVLNIIKKFKESVGMEHQKTMKAVDTQVTNIGQRAFDRSLETEYHKSQEQLHDNVALQGPSGTLRGEATGPSAQSQMEQDGVTPGSRLDNVVAQAVKEPVAGRGLVA
ncbi:MAG: hypothetical protein ACTJLL_04810, partial [Anaplasma sp.]